MNLNIRLWILTFFILPLGSLAQELSFSLKYSEQAIFQITNGKQRSGSGFFFQDQQTFVTAFHVVQSFFSEKSTDIPDSIQHEENLFSVSNPFQIRTQSIDPKSIIDTIYLSKNHTKQKQYKIIRIRALDARHDLAILDVEGYHGAVLKASTGKIKNKKPVHILGYPKIERGRLSRQDGTIYLKRSHSEHTSIIHQSHIMPYGSSEAPVLDKKGTILGVLTNAILFSNVLFQTPVSYLLTLLNQPPSNIQDDISDKEKINRAYVQLLEELKAEDAFAKWRSLLFYEKNRMPQKLANQYAPYVNLFRNRIDSDDYKNQLPFLKFRSNTLYNPNGTPASRPQPYAIREEPNQANCYLSFLKQKVRRIAHNSNH